MSTTVCLGEVIKRRDQVSDTCRNAIDQVSREQESRLAIFTGTEVSLNIEPKLLRPGQTSEQLHSVPFNSFRNLSIVGTNRSRIEIATCVMNC